MADTRRTRAYLLGTSFPDNTVGSISAQDMRDYVVSVMGSYANINNNAADGTPTAQAVANGTTVTLDWSLGSSGANGLDDTDGSSYGASSDYANDHIRIYTKGIFNLEMNISYKQGTAGNIIWTWLLATQADGGSITETGYKVKRLLGSTSEAAAISVSGFVDTTGHTTHTDVLSRLRHDNGSSQNMILQYGQLNVTRIG
jgi:hypothetical protein